MTQNEIVIERLNSFYHRIGELIINLDSSLGIGRDLTIDEKQLIKFASMPEIKAAMHRATVSIMIADSPDDALEEMMMTLHSILSGPVEVEKNRKY